MPYFQISDNIELIGFISGFIDNFYNLTEVYSKNTLN